MVNEEELENNLLFILFKKRTFVLKKNICSWNLYFIALLGGN